MRPLFRLALALPLLLVGLATGSWADPSAPVPPVLQMAGPRARPVLLPPFPGQAGGLAVVPKSMLHPMLLFGVVRVPPTGGGGGSISYPISDAEFALDDGGDGNELTFQLSALTTDRVVSWQDAAGTVALLEAAQAFTARMTWGTAADASNSMAVGETANCFTWEGSSADANETRLCGSNAGIGDVTINLPTVASGTVTLAALQTVNAWSAANTFGVAGYFFSGVEAVTTTKLTTANEGNETYTNTGDADGATVTLMDNPTEGLTHSFAVTVAQTLTIVPSTGESLYLGADQCVASITSNTVGSTLTLRAVVGGSGGVWMSMGHTGTLVCND